MKISSGKPAVVECYHCGDNCNSGIVKLDEKSFCCEGCKLVYDLLRDNDLCTYYHLNSFPGSTPTNQPGKFSVLDRDEISNNLVHFSDGDYAHVTFSVPSVHCSSCIWLLENLHRLNKGIRSSTVNFLRKEVTVIYNIHEVKLSAIAELMAHAGYEPHISLQDTVVKPKKKADYITITKIGIAGFCFGNSMMLSFPEYFSGGNFYDLDQLRPLFGYINLLLSLPVIFFSASGFFVSAWKSIRFRYLNIDGPIALAILVTFSRSIYEIITGTGAGYIDSMTGIVFFMLVGRYFQNRTYQTLSFERDYKSYFPIGVSIRKKDGSEENQLVSELKEADRVIIRNNELIPADCTLVSEDTFVDYSFITGESKPVQKQAGDFIYAGGRQLGGAIELEVANPVSQSYLTQLWNKDSSASSDGSRKTFVDKVNKWFTGTLLCIAFSSAIYWCFIDPHKALNAFTAVLIVACPCGLLLTSSFANGSILRIFGRNRFYLKNSEVIEKLTKTDTIVFDKTGTITTGASIEFHGLILNQYHTNLILSLASQSSHPLSRKISEFLIGGERMNIDRFEELPGQGLKSWVDGHYVVLGSEYFVTGKKNPKPEFATNVFVSVNMVPFGYFCFSNEYRPGLRTLSQKLSATFSLKILSGDNDSEKENIKVVFENAEMSFNKKPDEKMQYIQALRQQNHSVMMIGDGLNDAGALMQSDIGIAVSDNTNAFFPACDAILDGSSLTKLPQFISLARAGERVIAVTFIFSLLYNLAGLSFAVSGTLSPVVAAILMPLSSISIVLIATLSTGIIAKLKGL